MLCDRNVPPLSLLGRQRLEMLLTSKLRTLAPEDRSFNCSESRYLLSLGWSVPFFCPFLGPSSLRTESEEETPLFLAPTTKALKIVSV